MGFYDFRCMLTGVSLWGSDAVAVALQRTGDGYRPVTLGVSGSYNRFGSIDFIDEDLNTELVHRWFVEQARGGALFLDPSHHTDYGNPPHDIENLLNYLERNVSDSSEEHPALALNGERLYSALVERHVWDAVAETAGAGDPEVQFKHLFADSSIPTAIYQGRVADLAGPIAATYAVHEAAPAWAPMDQDQIGYQHEEEEILEWLEQARAAFRDSPAVLRALDAYEEQLEDEDDD